MISRQYDLYEPKDGILTVLTITDTTEGGLTPATVSMDQWVSESQSRTHLSSSEYLPERKTRTINHCIDTILLHIYDSSLFYSPFFVFRQNRQWHALSQTTSRQNVKELPHNKLRFNVHDPMPVLLLVTPVISTSRRQLHLLYQALASLLRHWTLKDVS